MKTILHIDEKAALEAALQKFRRYNKAMFISVDDNSLKNSNRLVEQIFKSEPGSYEETIFKSMLRKVAVSSIYNNKNIPNFRKEAQAKRIAINIDQAIEGAKNDYLYEKGFFGVGSEGKKKYEEAQKANNLIIKATMLDKMKSRLKDTPKYVLKKTGIKAVGAAIGGVIANSGLITSSVASLTTLTNATLLTVGGIAITPATLATTAVIATTAIAMDTAVKLIPEDIKKEMKSKAYECMESASVAIKSCVDKVRHTSVGKVVEQTYNNHVKPVVQKGVDCLKKVASKGIGLFQKFKSLF